MILIWCYQMTGKTIAEKILLAHNLSEKDSKPGDIINAKIDLIMSHFGTAKVSLDFNKIKPLEKRKVFDPQKIVVLFDHYNPAPTERWATIHDMIRKFVKTP